MIRGKEIVNGVNRFLLHNVYVALGAPSNNKRLTILALLIRTFAAICCPKENAAIVLYLSTSKPKSSMTLEKVEPRFKIKKDAIPSLLLRIRYDIQQLHSAKRKTLPSGERFTISRNNPRFYTKIHDEHLLSI